MRTALVLCLMLVSRVAFAAQVSIDCKDTPVDAVLAEIARQSGEKITLAAPSDAMVTARLDGVTIDDALNVVSDICGGTFVRVDLGYRVYPGTTPEYVLGLVRGMYSRIKDIDTISESVRLPGDKSNVASKGHSCWKYPRYLLSELQSMRDGEITAKTVSVCDGKYRWSWRTDSSEISRRKVSEKRDTPLDSIPVGLRGSAPEILGDIQADQLPNLRIAGAEVFRDRMTYVLESEHEPVMYDASRAASAKSAMAGAYGTVRRRPMPPELELVYQRPEIRIGIESANSIQMTRCGVDADTGLLVYTEYTYAGYVTREEASDIREAAPGILMPFCFTTIETLPGKEPRTSRQVRITAVKLNAGQDEKQFRFETPPNTLICDMDMDIKSCEEALKSSPDDPNLLYRHAQLLCENYDSDTVAKGIREYERVIALRPKAAGSVPRQVLRAASISRNRDAVAKYAAELLKQSPNDRDVRSAIAYAYRNVDMKKEALDAFGTLCSMYENRAEAPLDEVASICAELGDKARAEKLFLEVLKISDEAKCRTAAEGLVQIYTSEKRLESARQPLEAAVKRFPDSATLRFHYGFLLAKLNEPDLAMVQYRELARVADQSYLVGQAVRQLKAQHNYRSAKEIGTIFLSRQNAPSDKESLLSDMIEIYKLENMSVGQMIAAYRQFASPYGNAAASFRMMFAEKKVLSEAIEQVTTLMAATPADRTLARLLFELVQPESGSLDNATPSIAALKQLVAVFPDQAPLYGLLGEVHRAGKDYPEAVQAFRKGIELAPDQPYYYGSLATVYTLAGEHEKACELGRQLVDKDPNRYDFRCVLGTALANAGKYGEAVAQFRKADELTQALPQRIGRDISVLDALALCYTKLNDTTSVEQCLIAKADRVESWERANTLQQLAEFYVKNDKQDSAIATLIKLEKGASKTELRNAGYSIQNFRWQVPQENRLDFAKALETALQSESELVNCRMLLAGLYIEQKNMSAADSVIQELARKTWDDESALARAGALASSNSSYGDTAVKIWTRVVALNPKIAYQMHLARACQSAGMRDKALALVTKLLRDARNTSSSEQSELQSAASIAQECAYVFRSYQMYDECIDAFNAAIELNPERRDTCEMSIANVYESKSDYDSVLSICARIARESENVDRRIEALNMSASIYQRQEKKDMAVECYRRILSIADKDYQKENARRQIDRLTAPPPQ